MIQKEDAEINLYSSKLNIINNSLKESIIDLDKNLHIVRLVDTNLISFEKKTISKSLQDQLYILPMFMNDFNVDFNELRWIHKVVYETLKNFNIFLINSNKIKNNSDYLVFYSTFIGYIQDLDSNIPSPSALSSTSSINYNNNSVLYDPLEQEFRKISIEEEKNILEIKHDINVNKWNKFEAISNENISNGNHLFINMQLLIDFLDSRSDEIFDSQINPHLLVCSEGLEYLEDNQQEKSGLEIEIKYDNKKEKNELTIDPKLSVTNPDDIVFRYVVDILESKLNRYFISLIYL
jgi:hypothetical protein